MNNPEFNVELDTVNDVQFVKITVGCETLMLTPSDAQSFAEVVSAVAELPDAFDYIDNVFEDWQGS